MSMLPAIPASLIERMKTIGPHWGENVASNVREMVTAYSEILATTPREGLLRHNEIAYAGHERNVLDIFCPQNANSAPVIVFAHGGAFVDGSKDRSSEIYSNVLRCFNRHGFIGINLEYRLAPEFMFPSATDDIANAMHWIVQNIHLYGGDKNKIFIMGHSAGAAHSSDYVYRYNPTLTKPLPILGHIIVSGRVRIENRNDNPNARKVEAYYGVNQTLFEECSAIHHVNRNSVPTMFAIAQYENPLIDMHCMELANHIAQLHGRSPRLAWLEGHNHTSIIASLDTADDRLESSILGFLNEQLSLSKT
jgi:acetyl esterase/lipase